MEKIIGSTSLNVRLDSNLKKEADTLFKKLGLNMSTAINMFLAQSVREQAIPFEVKLETPSRRLLKALKEAEKLEKDQNRSGYETMEELKKALEE